MQDKYLRVAFSSVEEEHVVPLLDAIASTAEALSR